VENVGNLVCPTSYDLGEEARENARRAQPEIEIVGLSRTTGAGLEQWNDWIQRHL
jgi:Ni2+-binding GTPase involved in maturation of urease and hydrogenase